MRNILKNTYYPRNLGNTFSIQPMFQLAQRNAFKGISDKVSSHQIIWFFNEGGFCCINKKTIAIQRNTVIFIGKNQEHYFTNSQKEGFAIAFDDDFLIKDIDDYNILLRHNIFNNQNSPSLILEALETAKMTTLFELVLKEYNLDKLAKKEILRSYLKIILLSFQQILRKDNNHFLIGNTNDNRLFLKFQELLENNFQEIHTVEKFAIQLNISSRKLMTLTKGIYGQSPSEMIKERIILEAKRLLRHSILSIKEIAFQLSFEDPSNFSKFFKKYTDKTPKVFRASFSNKYH